MPKKMTTKFAAKDSQSNNGCPFIFKKDGTVCGKPAMTLTPITDKQRSLGIPCNDQGYTGSGSLCCRHVIWESYWPWCQCCGELKVSFEAEGITAGYCFMCIGKKNYLTKSVEEFVDPLLDEPASSEKPTWDTEFKIDTKFKNTPKQSPSSWVSKAAGKTIQKKMKTPVPELSPAKIEALKSEAVREQQRIMEEKRREYEESQAEYAKIEAAEELKCAAELAIKREQECKLNKEKLAAAFEAGFNDRQTEMLLKFINQSNF